ncbi:MAG: cell division protein FtsQ/DivIB [Hyphomicrobiales bacterium]
MRIGNGAAGAAGLSAQNVSITGLKRAVPQDILDIMGVWQGGSIVGFDAGEARRRLEAEDWIASASVLRQFPNRLHIEIVERVPFALWQIRGKFHVIDRDGMTLGRFAVRDNMELPIVVGEGAEKQALRLINDLEAWPDLKLQVRAAALVAERRWTLYLLNGIKVLLPEERVAEALREIDRLDREHDLLNRDVVAVDLRLGDRTVIRLSDKVVKIRTAKLAELGGR